MTKAVELTITTETIEDEDETFQVIEQSGQLGEDIEWTADAMTEDHGYVEITATVYDEKSLNDLIAKLELLRGAARQVAAVYGC
jgi:hypothetical protein